MSLLGGEANAGSGAGGNAGASSGGGAGGNPAAGGSSSGASGASGSGGAAANTGAGNGNGQGSGGTALSGSDGGGQKSWRDSLPDDLKGDATLSKFSDIPNLAKSYLELQKKIGQKGIFKPGPNASPEEVAAFREALGIPKADQYKIDTAKFKDMEFPADSVEWAQKAGAELGIHPDQMTEMMQSYAKFEWERDAAVEKEVKEIAQKQLEDLKTEWGEGYDRNIARAGYAAKQIGGKEFLDYLESTGMGNDVQLIRFMNKVAPLLGEDRLREGNLGDGRSTPAELDAKIAGVQSRLMGMKQGDGARQGLLQELESLFKQKTGGR